MSQIKIKNLPEKIDNLNDEDMLVIEDTEDTKKISLIRLKSAFSMDGILTSIKDMLVSKINSFIEIHDIRCKELEYRNKQLEVTCNNLENDHKHDMDRISDLLDRMIILNNSFKTIESDNTNLNRSLIELQREKQQLLETINELHEQLASSQSNIIDLSTQFDDLLLKYNELNEENSNLKNTINELETNYNSTVDNFVNDTNIELQTKMEELMSYIRHYHPDVDSLEV